MERAAKNSPNAKKNSPNAVSRNMQIIRVARIASLLKKNSCPTAEGILKEYESLSIGDGQLGQTVFRYICADSRFDDIPLILETPDDSRWTEEINQFKSWAGII